MKWDISVTPTWSKRFRIASTAVEQSGMKTNSYENLISEQ